MSNRQHEVKVRAWDAQGEIMHYDFESMSVGVTGQVIFQSDKHKFNFDEWPPNYDINMGGILFKTYSIRVLDVEEKIIYEHDIVEVTDGKSKWIGIVQIGSSGCPSISAVDYPINEDYSHAWLYEKNKQFRVIGNSYENPELCPELKFTYKIDGLSQN